jgi:putative DNA primase/helicase
MATSKTKQVTTASNKPDLSPAGIVKLVLPQIKTFHTPNSEPYSRIWIADHWETHAIGSQSFGYWLHGFCYSILGYVPTPSIIAAIRGALAADARFKSRERQTYVRVAPGQSGEIYVDLGNPKWNAVRITAEGWSLPEVHPIMFRRPVGTAALPVPVEGGSISELRSFLNLEDDDQWVLTVAWLLGALRPTGPYPLCILEGSHGSAKSTTTRVLRQLIDPNASPVRSEPANQRDLMISAANSHLLALDNLSYVPNWLSDALCRLATGGGFATRKLYSDDEEKLFEAMRPVLLNGIDLGVDRGDLLDRAIVLSLPVISGSSRETESKFWRRFEEAQPRILGSLYDLVAYGLRRQSSVNLPDLPRMADFASFVTAIEPAVGWQEGTFLDAHSRNRSEANAVALEDSSLAEPIVRIADAGPWEGTATDLRLKLIDESVYDSGGVQRSYPSTAKETANVVRRLAPGLAQIGVEVQFKRSAGNDSKRIITIRRRFHEMASPINAP